MILHAGLLALRVEGCWRGALVRGASSSGKSDLALRALYRGFSLVADDRVIVWASGGRLFGRAADALGGMIEVRGLGVTRRAFRPFSGIDLICDATDGAVERMPEPAAEALLGISVPTVKLAYREASAPDKLRLALSILDKPV